MPSRKRYPYYFVPRGYPPGIYDDWLLVQEAIRDVPGATQRGCDTLTEAREVMAQFSAGGYIAFIAPRGGMREPSKPLEYPPGHGPPQSKSSLPQAVPATPTTPRRCTRRTSPVKSEPAKRPVQPPPSEVEQFWQGSPSASWRTPSTSSSPPTGVSVCAADEVDEPPGTDSTSPYSRMRGEYHGDASSPPQPSTRVVREQRTQRFVHDHSHGSSPSAPSNSCLAASPVRRAATEPTLTSPASRHGDWPRSIPRRSRTEPDASLGSPLRLHAPRAEMDGSTLVSKVFNSGAIEQLVHKSSTPVIFSADPRLARASHMASPTRQAAEEATRPASLFSRTVQPDNGATTSRIRPRAARAKAAAPTTHARLPDAMTGTDELRAETSASYLQPPSSATPSHSGVPGPLSPISDFSDMALLMTPPLRNTASPTRSRSSSTSSMSSYHSALSDTSSRSASPHPSIASSSSSALDDPESMALHPPVSAEPYSVMPLVDNMSPSITGRTKARQRRVHWAPSPSPASPMSQSSSSSQSPSDIGRGRSRDDSVNKTQAVHVTTTLLPILETRTAPSIVRSGGSDTVQLVQEQSDSDAIDIPTDSDEDIPMSPARVLRDSHQQTRQPVRWARDQDSGDGIPGSSAVAPRMPVNTLPNAETSSASTNDANRQTHSSRSVPDPRCAGMAAAVSPLENGERFFATSPSLSPSSSSSSRSAKAPSHGKSSADSRRIGLAPCTFAVTDPFAILQPAHRSNAVLSSSQDPRSPVPRSTPVPVGVNSVHFHRPSPNSQSPHVLFGS